MGLNQKYPRGYFSTFACSSLLDPSLKESNCYQLILMLKKYIYIYQKNIDMPEQDITFMILRIGKGQKHHKPALTCETACRFACEADSGARARKLLVPLSQTPFKNTVL